MAFSRKMLAVLQKVDAARGEYFACLRASANSDARLREARKRSESAKRKPPKLVSANDAGKIQVPKRRAGAG